MDRKTTWSSLIAVFLLVVVPSSARAQAQFSESYSWGPFSLNPTASVGYVLASKPASLSFEMNNANVLQIINLTQKLTVQGVWAELVLPIRTSSPLGLALDFGYLFPQNRHSSETYKLTYGDAARNWTSRTQIGKFEAAITYEIYPSVTTVLGFRYDSFLTNLKEPENQVSGTLVFRTSQSADFNFTGYLPILGVLVERSLGQFNSVKAGVVGFPSLPGAFVYREVVYKSGDHEGGGGFAASNEFRSGYFLEAFCEFSTPVYPWAHLSAFAKYNGVYGKTTVDVNTTIRSTELAAESWNNEADVTFERSIWVVGASATVNFWLW